MEDSLIQRMSQLSDRLQGLPERFGVPDYQHVVELVRRGDIPEGSYVPTEEKITLEPTPKVSQLSSKGTMAVLKDRAALGDGNVSLKYRVYNVTGISAAQFSSEEELQGEWIIDGKRGYVGLYVERELTGWKVMLRSPLDPSAIPAL